MTDPNEVLRRERLNKALRKVKEMAYKTRKTHYIVHHGRWAYRVTTRLPKDRRNLVFWSNNGE